MVQNFIDKVFKFGTEKNIKPEVFKHLRISDMTMCSGCGACFNICPAGAITMEPDDEGFIYPVVDYSLCTNCGLCERVCPKLYPVENKNMPGAECFAAMAEDDVRMDGSSSGGAFTILAENVVNGGGYVCGAELTEDGTVEHIIVNTVEDVKRLRGAKYLQSNIGNSYSEIKKLLMAGRQVLFTGTPCQVAGLKSYLGINYEKLLTVDILCSGVPSPKVFQKYLAEIVPIDEVFVSANFLDKHDGWSPELCKITTTTNNCEYSFGFKEDAYLKSFINNLSLRKSCNECEFHVIPRQGDITIGDFRGIEAYDPELNDEKGISVLLANNMKGKAFLESISSEFKLLKNVPLKFALDDNPGLISEGSVVHNRKLFFNYFEKKGLAEALDLSLSDRCDYLIVNFWWSSDFGTAISSWALQTVLEGFGFIPKFLNHKDSSDGMLYKDSSCEKFAHDYLYITNEVKTFDDLKRLSKGAKGLITGAGNVFNVDSMGGNLGKYMLDWALIDNKKFAISAGFGLEKEDFAPDSFLESDTFRYMKTSLDTFDYVSCRELSGVEICKDVFGVWAETVLDSVFLVDKAKYNDILKNSSVRTSGKVVSYLQQGDDRDIHAYIKGKYGFDVHSVDSKNDTVENWLKAIYDCRFLITDSYYGVCFALIFNKPFVCVKKASGDTAGLDNLCSIFGLNNFFIESLSEFYNQDFLFGEVPDWKEINSVIEKERRRCLKIIERVLNDTKVSKGKEQYISHLLNNGFAGIYRMLHNELDLKTFVSSKGSRSAYFITENSNNLPDWLTQKNIYIPKSFEQLPDGNGGFKVYNELLKGAIDTLDVVITDDDNLALLALKLKKLVCYCKDVQDEETKNKFSTYKNLRLCSQLPQVCEFENEKHRANLKFLKESFDFEKFRSCFY